MRKLKFRVWHKDLNKFLSSEEWIIDLNGSLKFVAFGDGNNLELLSINPKLYTIQQFTGLLDKNDKEIYEGDILEYLNQNGEVIFFYGTYFLSYKDQTDDQLSYMQRDKFFIIGNISENPELLK